MGPNIILMKILKNFLKRLKTKQSIMNNNNDLPYEDLCNLIAIQIPHASVNSADKYLTALYKVILRQLELHNRILIKGFGVFEIKERKSGERIINNPILNEKQIVNENNFKLADDKKVKKHNSHKVTKHKKKHKKMKNIADLLNRAEKNKKKGLL